MSNTALAMVASLLVASAAPAQTPERKDAAPAAAARAPGPAPRPQRGQRLD